MLIWHIHPTEDMESFPPGNGTNAPPWDDDSLPAGSYDDHVDVILAVAILTMIVAAIFAALRIYVRGFMIKKWGLDDTFLVFSFVTAVAHGSMICLATRFGLGRHVWIVPPATLVKGTRLGLIVTMAYHTAFITIKITFLLQYRRVFPLPTVELFCNIGISFLALFGISLLISSGVTYHFVYHHLYETSRVSILGWWLANASIHLVTDILIFILPLPLLSRLRIKKAQKLALLASFGLGFLTCAVSIIRIVTLPYTFSSFDQTYQGTATTVWTLVELSCAIICCCIPTLRPLAQRSLYQEGGSRASGSGFRSNDRSVTARTPGCNRPDAPRMFTNERVSSSISCESEVAIRKPTSSGFFWQRSRQQSENSTIGGADEVEPVPVVRSTVTIPVTITATPVAARSLAGDLEMPVLEVNGCRRPSECLTVDSAGLPRRTHSIRSSLRSDGSSLGIYSSLQRNLSFRRHMSMTLTERDSDDDTYYFGVNEEVDMECPTPLSPPPKSRQSGGF